MQRFHLSGGGMMMRSGKYFNVRIQLVLAVCLVLVTSRPVSSATQQPAFDRGVLQIQVILDKVGFSPGVIDGRGGQSLTLALKGFQEARGLPRTGALTQTRCGPCGIHGTPEPSTIGRAESHGRIRLTNWDAARLALMVRPGIPALFQP